jgi:hypothetical protein
MNLAEIRKMFVKLSGRYDLVLPDGSDDGADFFIREGQKFIDKLSENEGSGGKAELSLAVGEYNKSLDARVIKSVFAVSADGERWPLEKVLYSDMNRLYSEKAENLTRSVPVYYSPIPARIISTITDTNYNGVMIFPPTDSAITLEVFGKIHAETLDSDDAYNFWTDNHPMVIVLSAMRYLEVTNRNREGVKDYETAIANELTLLEKDFVEQEIAEFDAIGG